jgi:DNA mismatch repair ATPase MutS
MFLDTSTLQDLEIVATPGRRGTTLWGMVDRTRTQSGAQALRQRLLAPFHTSDEIVALQQAHHALAAEETYRFLLDRADLNGVEGYLAVAWQLPEAMPALARFRRWYRHYIKDVAEGQRRVAGLFTAAADLRARLSTTGASVLRKLGEELAVLLEDPAAREVQALASQSELRAFDQAARGRGKSVLSGVVRLLGSVESLWSLGTATIEHGWHYPRPSATLRAAGLVHPFLGARAVANDLQFDEAVRVCLVTGPNMAGKSTFLKAVSIAVLLAHAGCGVPATSMDFPVVSTLFSSININDNLDAGESFYLAEVRRIAVLAKALRDRGAAVAVIDEPFRGTNVHDAAEATLAVITRLANHPAALVFVASHLGEIAPALVDDPRIVFLHFEAEVAAADVLRFDYRIREGVSSQRLGMTLLRHERVLELLNPSPTFDEQQPDIAMEPTART